MITFEDASTLLGLAAARDQRTVGRADILAWHADLSAAGLTRADAETALTVFYQEMANRQPKDRYRVTAVDLIDIAKRDPNPDLRKRALFWLGQSDDSLAVKALQDIIEQP